MFTITTACGVETISGVENEQKTKETSKEQANDNSVVQEETDKANEEEKTSNSNNTSDSEKEKITFLFSSGSESADYLRKELDMENKEDIYFEYWGDGSGRLEKDSYGSYYTISLKSKSMQEAGGDGKVGIYKVYQVGKYELKHHSF